MRKLRVSILLTIVALFMFAAMIGPTQKVNAVLREKFYTVILAEPCPFGWPGKPPYGTVMGEWTLDCDGNWDGWGWTPNEENCKDVEITLGQQCYQ